MPEAGRGRENGGVGRGVVNVFRSFKDLMSGTGILIRSKIAR